MVMDIDNLPSLLRPSPSQQGPHLPDDQHAANPEEEPLSPDLDPQEQPTLNEPQQQQQQQLQPVDNARQAFKGIIGDPFQRCPLCSHAPEGVCVCVCVCVYNPNLYVR